MTPLDQSFVGLGVILLLIALRVPIGLALALVATIGTSLLIGWRGALALMGRIPFEFAASWEFSAVPAFLLMGAIAYRSGMTGSIFEAARLWLGRLPGGLAVATNFAAAGFGAACGSSLATTVAMGKIAVPEMLRWRYEPGLATATCACAGTLAALIPPSIPFIVYAILAEQSVSKLFLAGVIPGILTAVAYAVMIVGRCVLNPALAPAIPERPGWGERFAALARMWELPVLALLVLGGIYGGIVTPTEAGAVGAVLAALLAAAKGALSWTILRDSLREAAHTTAAILFIAIGAVMLARYLALTGLPLFIADAIAAWSIDPLLFIVLSAAIFLVLGMFLDPFGIMVISVSVMLPAYERLGYDLIWFGVILVKYIEIGLITPPVGLNVFAAKSIAPPEIALETIFRGVGWFLVAEAVVMALLLGFPGLSLWLPNLAG